MKVTEVYEKHVYFFILATKNNKVEQVINITCNRLFFFFNIQKPKIRAKELKYNLWSRCGND